MEASLTPIALRKLTRSLACLARFGETVTLLALPSELVLTTLSASKTAHAKVTLALDFFETYGLLPGAPRRGITCDLNLKALLGVLRLRAGENLETCELRLVDHDQMVVGRGGSAAGGRGSKRRKVDGAGGGGGGSSSDGGEEELDGEDEGTGKREQPRFSVRLTFPGFAKLHSLQISTPPPIGVPVAPSLTSHFTTSARSVLSWMEAFPSWSRGPGGGGAGVGKQGSAGGGSKEEFLAWAFGRDGVRISSWAANAKQDQLSTDLSVGIDAFDGFYLAPTFSASAARDQAVGFPMREFKAVTYLALHLGRPMFARFAGPFQPLSLSLPAAEDDADPAADDCAFEFLIMTRDVPSAGGGGRREAKVERAAGAGKGREPAGGGEVRASGGGRKLHLASGQTSEGGDPSGLQRDGREREVSEMDLEGGLKGDHAAEAYDDDQGGQMDYGGDDEGVGGQHRLIPPAPRVSSLGGGSQQQQPRNASAGPSRAAVADMTFSHPLAHSTARPPAVEPLFYPGSQAASQAGPFPTQLTQAELEDLGLGNLDAVDFAMDEEDEWDVGGDVVVEGGERSVVAAGRQDDQEDDFGGTQIAQTQVAGTGRAFTRFVGGDSDEELEEADTAAADGDGINADGSVRTQVAGSSGNEGVGEDVTYEMSLEV